MFEGDKLNTPAGRGASQVHPRSQVNELDVANGLDGFGLAMNTLLHIDHSLAHKRHRNLLPPRSYSPQLLQPTRVRL